MNPARKTYQTMTNLMGTVMSEHPDAPLTINSTIGFGILAALSNILHANNPRQQWKDICTLAKSAMEIIDEQGGVTAQQQTMSGDSSTKVVDADQGKPGRTYNNVGNRAPDSPLTHPEQIAAKIVARNLKGITIQNLSPEHGFIIDSAITQPGLLDLEQFNKLMALAYVL